VRSVKDEVNNLMKCEMRSVKYEVNSLLKWEMGSAKYEVNCPFKVGCFVPIGTVGG
jgi:hypothetical protein